VVSDDPAYVGSAAFRTPTPQNSTENQRSETLNLNHIPHHVVVPTPQIWAGTYRYLVGADGSWSWYKDGKRDATCLYAIDGGAVEANFAPHLTISVAPHETGPGNSWLGFHVSIPVATPGGGVVNARFNYKVAGGKATFSITTKKGFADANLDAIEMIARDKWKEIDAFAKSFVTAAWR
jgi:hypothetical protein